MLFHVVPAFVEYCKKTPSGVEPLMSGASHGEGSELLSGLLYSKLTVPPPDTSMPFDVNALGQAELAIHK